MINEPEAYKATINHLHQEDFSSKTEAGNILRQLSIGTIKSIPISFIETHSFNSSLYPAPKKRRNYESVNTTLTTSKKRPSLNQVYTPTNVNQQLPPIGASNVVKDPLLEPFPLLVIPQNNPFYYQTLYNPVYTIPMNPTTVSYCPSLLPPQVPAMNQYPNLYNTPYQYNSNNISFENLADYNIPNPTSISQQFSG